LVEDEQSLHSLIARGLRSRGYSVIEASNGVDALEALEQSNVDLVPADVVGYSGDVFEKSLPENQPLLPKPFRLGQLVTAVKETMSLS
jgi:two-component system, cell cycle sensor histidine kinase and response regulator CckA